MVSEYRIQEFKKREAQELLDTGRFKKLNWTIDNLLNRELDNDEENFAIEQPINYLVANFNIDREKIDSDEKFKSEFTAVKLEYILEDLEVTAKNLDKPVTNYAVFSSGSYGTNERNIASDVDLEIVFENEPEDYSFLQKQLKESITKLNSLGGHEIKLWFQTVDKYNSALNQESLSDRICKALSETPSHKEYITSPPQEKPSKQNHEDWSNLCPKFLVKLEAGTGVVLHDNSAIEIRALLENINREEVPFEEAIGIGLIASRDLADAILEENIPASNSLMSKAILRATAGAYISLGGIWELSNYTEIADNAKKVSSEYSKIIHVLYHEKRNPKETRYLCEGMYNDEKENENKLISDLRNIVEEANIFIETSVKMKDPCIDFYYKLVLNRYFEETAEAILEEFNKSKFKEAILTPYSELKKIKERLNEEINKDRPGLTTTLHSVIAYRRLPDELTDKLKNIILNESKKSILSTKLNTELDSYMRKGEVRRKLLFPYLEGLVDYAAKKLATAPAEFKEYPELINILSADMAPPDNAKEHLFQTELNFIRLCFAKNDQDIDKLYSEFDKHLNEAEKLIDQEEQKLDRGRFVNYRSKYYFWKAISFRIKDMIQCGYYRRELERITTKLKKGNNDQGLKERARKLGAHIIIESQFPNENIKPYLEKSLEFDAFNLYTLKLLSKFYKGTDKLIEILVSSYKQKNTASALKETTSQLDWHLKDRYYSIFVSYFKKTLQEDYKYCESKRKHFSKRFTDKSKQIEEYLSGTSETYGFDVEIETEKRDSYRGIADTYKDLIHYQQHIMGALNDIEDASIGFIDLIDGYKYYTNNKSSAYGLIDDVLVNDLLNKGIRNSAINR